MSNITFARNLVKGKIAETIFAQMYRETRSFTVLEFGYEKVIPELIQQGGEKNNIMLETLRTAPDFAVIDQLRKEVRLIEVKYMRSLNYNYVFKDAERMSKSWNPSYLFIATLDGFYFDGINKIIEKKGEISELEIEYPQISKEIQTQYLQILIDFEGKN